MRVSLEVFRVTPSRRPDVIARSDIHGNDLVARRQGRLVMEVESVLSHEPWATYEIEVKGVLDPGDYVVELVGEGVRKRCKESFSPNSLDEETTFWITMNGPLLERFVVRLVQTRVLWKPGKLLVVDGCHCQADGTPSIYAGSTVTVVYDWGDERGVRVEWRTPDGLHNHCVELPREFLSPVPNISQE